MTDGLFQLARFLTIGVVCGECLGEYRENCANEDGEKYSTHNGFMVIRIKDPLLLSDPDEWFKKQKIIPDHIDPTIFDRNKIRRRFDRTNNLVIKYTSKV